LTMGPTHVPAAARPQPAAFFLGEGHRIVHGNEAFIESFGASCLGLPAREALVDLPAAAFEVMDAVYRTGRPLARNLTLPSGRFRLVVAPRRDPDGVIPYGIAAHLRRLEET
ncbi:MAG TPA: hypothetical protein VEY67_00210, partial [Candidatus Dormibacteraeota bacterium]|nr:hypothetical protein [Candidatus Dormibacteraeota bacterium]